MFDNNEHFFNATVLGLQLARSGARQYLLFVRGMKVLLPV